MKIIHLFMMVLLIFVSACSSLLDGVNEAPQEEPLGLAVEQEVDESQNRQAPLVNAAPVDADDASIVLDGVTSMQATSAPQSESGEESPAQPETTVEGGNFEDYGVNPFVETAQDNLSTFAMDVDTASYTYARTSIVDYRQLPNPAAIRPEEFINYYPANYSSPDDEAFAIHMDAAPSPFSEEGQLLLRVGIQGRVIAPEERAPALLIFVIDISGSMSDANRLELAKQSLEILTSELREDDRVAIVVYSDAARVVLNPTTASEQSRIIEAIRSLQTEGSTYAEEGLRLGYDVALANMREGQITRVVLVSDGVANVGATGPDAILQTVRQGVEGGVTLTTVGFGMTFNDVLMEQLANDGNGNYFYIDNLREARRIFSYNLTSTLQVIAYDARIQVEFNPDTIVSYRLIGYENRAIADESFRDDTVDAGEVGAGHSITALYELELVQGASTGNLAIAHLRYEDADTRQVIEISQSFELEDSAISFDSASVEFRATAALAEYSEILRQSPYGESDFTAIIAVLENLQQSYPPAEELLALVRATMNLQPQ